MPAGVDVEPDMVAARQSPGGVVQAQAPFLGPAGVEFGAERLQLDAEPVRTARVVPEHVQQRAAAPELLAVLEFVHDRRTVGRVVGADHDEQAHAQPDEPARQPVQREHRHRQHPPQAFEGQRHRGPNVSKSRAEWRPSTPSH